MASSFLCQCHKHIYEYKNSAKKTSATSTVAAASPAPERSFVYSYSKTMKMKSGECKEQNKEKPNQTEQNVALDNAYRTRIGRVMKCYILLVSFSIDRALQSNEKRKGNENE